MKRPKIQKTDLITATLFVLGGTVVVFSHDISQAIYSSMLYSVTQVVPTLFPMLVISNLIVSFRENKTKRNTVMLHFQHFFGLSDRGATAAILSFIGSFPIGAVALCNKAEIKPENRRAVERELALTHNTGPSFPIAFVGGILYGRKSFGVWLYLSQILSWVTIARLYKCRNMQLSSFASVVDDKCRCGFGGIFSDAVSTSALTCVNIAAFSAFMRAAEALLLLFFPAIPNTLSAILATFLEFSNGCMRSATIGGIVGCVLCGFAVGFGGLCAILQAGAFATKCSLSLRPLIIVKLFEGILCGAACAVYALIFPFELSKNALTAFSSFHIRKTPICLAVYFLLYLMFKIFSKTSKDGKIT